MCSSGPRTWTWAVQQLGGGVRLLSREGVGISAELWHPAATEVHDLQGATKTSDVLASPRQGRVPCRRGRSPGSRQTARTTSEIGYQAEDADRGYDCCSRTPRSASSSANIKCPPWTGSSCQGVVLAKPASPLPCDKRPCRRRRHRARPSAAENLPAWRNWRRRSPRSTADRGGARE